MNRTCPKCDTVKTDATGAVDEICPSCGVVFAKAALSAISERAKKRADSADSDMRDRPWLVERVAWLICFLGALAGIAQLTATFVQAQSAPQQGAGAALAAACALIPYCLARAIQLGMRR